MTLTRTPLLAAALSAFVACGEETAVPTSSADVGQDGTPRTDVEAPPDTGSPHVPEVSEPTGRVVRRMTVEQLARSIPVITGGVAWIEDFGAGPTDMLGALAGTLGAPDYLLVTEETLEPTLIIAKFMQDAADRVCPKWVEKDRAASVADRTLVRGQSGEDWDSVEPYHVRESLRRLLLRGHGRYFADGEPELELYVGLFNAASDAAPAGFGARDGWLATCIGMFTDPALLLY